MKTGQFIKAQYDKELERISKEFYNAVLQMKEETEILELQSKIKIHGGLNEGAMILYFSQGGEVNVSFNSVKAVWMHSSEDVNFEVKPFKGLERCTLPQLKQVHPKRLPELLRQLAKKKFLEYEEPVVSAPTFTQKLKQFFKRDV